MPFRKKRRTNPKELFQDIFWPQDLLPKIFPRARVITWGYDVQIEKIFTPTSKSTLFHHAQTLLSDLAMLRNSTSDKAKPLMFVAHSLGGIVVKDALSQSKNDLTYLKEILPNTTGVIFPWNSTPWVSDGFLGKGSVRIIKISSSGPEY